MNRNRKLKTISYALAAAILTGAATFTSAAAPLAGASSVLSTAKLSEPVAAETAGDIVETENTFSAFAGVNLAVAQMVREANSDAVASISASNTMAVAAKAEEVKEEEPEPVDEFADIAVSQVNDYVNVRSGPSEDTDVVGKLYNNCAAHVLSEEGDWYQISSGKCNGYVKSMYVVVGDEDLARQVGRRVATVTADTLNVRTEPTTEAEILDQIPNGDDVTVIDESLLGDGWVKVSVDSGDGFVSLDYVTLSTEYRYAESKEEEEARLAKEEAERQAAARAAADAAARKRAAAQARTGRQSSSSSGGSSRTYNPPSGGSGSAVIEYASQFIGNPYVYGGSSLTGGTDCSGFVMSVYKAFGVSLPHSSAADRSVGYGVSADQMQPGDIICYSGHVALYAGGGRIVHASNRRTGITTGNVNYRNILAVRRIF